VRLKATHDGLWLTLKHLSAHLAQIIADGHTHTHTHTHTHRLSKHPNLRRYGDPQSLKGGGEADYFGRELLSRNHMERTWRE
jgi:hypothetical protein